jgi:hypothetical protein
MVGPLMPIYAVGERNQRVQIPSQALAVSISGSVSDAALDVRGQSDQPVMGSTAALVVLPRLTGPVLIGVRPVTGPQFGPGTVVSLSIGPDTTDDVDPVQVLFDPVDVSGDSGVEFARLTPQGARIEVSATAVADTPLSGLASAARSSARRVAGRGARPPGSPVVVALDTSASMRSAFANGSAAAATDIVVGVADAVGVRDVSALLVGSEATPVTGAAVAGLAEAVGRATPQWSAGARWSRLGPARAIVCSDFPTLSVRQRFPMIAISNDRRLDGDCARLPPPRPGADASAELLDHPAVLDRITASLVRSLT